MMPWRGQGRGGVFAHKYSHLIKNLTMVHTKYLVYSQIKDICKQIPPCPAPPLALVNLNAYPLRGADTTTQHPNPYGEQPNNLT